MRLGRSIGAVCLSLVGWSPSIAQQLEGTLRDRSNREPIPGAFIRLVGDGDTVVAITITDDAGGFRLTAPETGNYVIRAQRLGYDERQSAPFELLANGTYRLLLDLSATPVVLDPVEVIVRSTESRRSVLGMNLRALGGRLLTSEWIETRRRGASSVGTFIRWSNVPGVSVIHGHFDTECVQMVRGRMSAEQTKESCAVVYVDGVRYPRDRLRDIDPDFVEEILLLRPSEAGVLFGTGSEGGVVLIYTRGNRAH